MFKIATTSFVDNFSMKFANGFTVSLAIGPDVYSTGDAENGFVSAEVGVWDANGDWIELDGASSRSVVGWQSPEQVLAIMNKVAAM